MKPQIRAALSGKFELIVKDKFGNVKTRVEKVNRIVNGGLNYLCTTNSGPAGYAYLGSGTTPVQDTDLDLALPTHRLAVTSSSRDLSQMPAYAVNTYNTEFPVGTVVGFVREVGQGWRTGSSPNWVYNLFSRVVLDDPVEVTAEDTLTVVYRLYSVVPQTDLTYTVTEENSEIDYTVTARMIGANSSNSTNSDFYRFGAGFYINAAGLTPFGRAFETQTLLPMTDIVPTTGRVNSNEYYAWKPYVADSFEREFDIRWLAPNANFATGIGRIILESYNTFGAWQFSFNPKIPKTIDNILSFTCVFILTRGVPPV